jgi:hypothetical protein
VVHGVILKSEAKSYPHLGGRNVHRMLYNMLMSRFGSAERAEFSSLGNMTRSAVVTDIMERLQFVALSTAHHQKSVSDASTAHLYTLPSSSSRTRAIDIKLQNLHMTFCGEYLFRPREMVDDADSSLVALHSAIAQVIAACPIDTRGPMWGNVVLTGGLTLLPGFQRRLQNELVMFKDGKVAAEINVLAENERGYSNWGGGAILSVLDEIEGKYTARWEYEEHGPDREEPHRESQIIDDFYNN